MNNTLFLAYLIVMAGTTYLIRMIPLVLIKKKIENRLLLSFLYYIPYSVLTVMTIPAIFASTSYLISAVLGFIVAVILAYKEKSLLTVAVFAVLTVFIAECIIKHT